MKSCSNVKEPGRVRHGAARPGEEQGGAWHGWARQGMARQGTRTMAGLGRAWLGAVRLGMEQGIAGRGPARRGVAGNVVGQGTARQGAAWHGTRGQYMCHHIADCPTATSVCGRCDVCPVSGLYVGRVHPAPLFLEDEIMTRQDMARPAEVGQGGASRCGTRPGTWEQAIFLEDRHGILES